MRKFISRDPKPAKKAPKKKPGVNPERDSKVTNSDISRAMREWDRDCSPEFRGILNAKPIEKPATKPPTKPKK